jgi:hypothetical protein
MRRFLQAFVFLMLSAAPLYAQEDKKTDDLKPNDPDTGESTVEETTLGLLPNPFERRGIKFAVTYIGETLGNVSGGLKRGAVYEDRFNFALDIDFEKLAGVKQLRTSPSHGGLGEEGPAPEADVARGFRIVWTYPAQSRTGRCRNAAGEEPGEVCLTHGQRQLSRSPPSLTKISKA